MLTHLYTLDYDDMDASQAVAVAASQNLDGHVVDLSSKSKVLNDAMTSYCKRMNNVRVYALAEKHNIPALKELAKTKFKKCQIACNITLSLGRSSTQSSRALLTRIRLYGISSS